MADRVGRQAGYFTSKIIQKINKNSIKILKEICLDVIYGKSNDLKTKKTVSKEEKTPIFKIQTSNFCGIFL